MTRYIYLHGFTSSPQSGKATYFRQRFAACGVTLDVPQLDEGNFERMTMSSQAAVIDRAVGDRPSVLLGSSLGGYLAAWYAARHQEVERVVLMAPAFFFLSRWQERFSAREMDLWRRQGSLPIFHYGSGQDLPLAYSFIEEALSLEDEPRFTQPGLILHGTLDPVVPVSTSESYAQGRANITLRRFNSGHELTDVLDPMWGEIRPFLSFPGQ